MGKENRKFLMISQTQDLISLDHFRIPKKNLLLSKIKVNVRSPKKLEAKVDAPDTTYEEAFKRLYIGHF